MLCRHRGVVRAVRRADREDPAGGMAAVADLTLQRFFTDGPEPAVRRSPACAVRCSR
jgi:hypothetical protein